MIKYFFFWIFFIVVSSIWHGYQVCKETQEGGYDFDQTGNKVMFKSGPKETILGTLAGALGLLVSPSFLFIETLKFVPAAVVLYLIS